MAVISIFVEQNKQKSVPFVRKQNVAPVDNLLSLTFYYLGYFIGYKKYICKAQGAQINIQEGHFEWSLE